MPNNRRAGTLTLLNNITRVYYGPNCHKNQWLGVCLWRRTEAAVKSPVDSPLQKSSNRDRGRVGGRYPSNSLDGRGSRCFGPNANPLAILDQVDPIAQVLPGPGERDISLGGQRKTCRAKGGANGSHNCRVQEERGRATGPRQHILRY